MKPAALLASAPSTPETAPADAAAILSGTLKAMGFIPNLYARMANFPAALKTYSDGYSAFRSNAGFSPAEQELVFLTISKVNECGYCLAAHLMIAEKMSGVPEQALSALLLGGEIEDKRLAELFAFARSMVESRGQPSPEAVQAFLAPGYTETQILAIVLAIAVKTLSNYTNQLFATPIDVAFAGHVLEPG